PQLRSAMVLARGPCLLTRDHHAPGRRRASGWSVAGVRFSQTMAQRTLVSDGRRARPRLFRLSDLVPSPCSAARSIPSVTSGLAADMVLLHKLYVIPPPRFAGPSRGSNTAREPDPVLRQCSRRIFRLAAVRAEYRPLVRVKPDSRGASPVGSAA